MESLSRAEAVGEPDRDENVLRRHMNANPRRAEIAQHKLWLDAIQREYPMPYTPYKIGVYIRYYNERETARSAWIRRSDDPGVQQ